MRIGIIGVGIISTAFVKGLLSEHGAEISIALSPRNAERAGALAAEYRNVEVKASNQMVLDSSDWVILAVLPRIAEEVLTELKFRPDHQVIDLIANYSVAQVREWIGPTASLTRMVPLPFIAQKIGPLTFYPDSPQLTELVAGLGDLVPATTEQELDLLQVITALMSTYYATLGRVISWGTDNGLSAEVSANYSISFFAALLTQAKSLPTAEILEIWKEMTPGGLNELAVTHVQAAGALTAWEEALDKVFVRVRSVAKSPLSE